MVDQWSVKMLDFNFASSILANRELAQGGSRCCSFIREYMVHAIKARTNVVNILMISQNRQTQYSINHASLELHYGCIRKTVLIITIKIEVEYFGKTIIPQGVIEQKEFVAGVRFLKSKEQLQQYKRFANFRLSDNININININTFELG